METKHISNKKLARLAGLFYLIIIVTGIFSEFVVRSKIIVEGDAAATAKNIMDFEGLFRQGIVSDIIMSTAFLMMGITFYVLLKSVNKYVALVMLVFNIIGVPIMCLNLMSQYAPLLLLSGADYLSVFSVDQLNALVLFFMNMHHYGYILATISYGTYLLPLGYLVYKSGFMPKILGIMLMIGAFSWLGDLFTKFLITDMNSTISTIIQIPESIAEFSFFFWLIIKGARE